MFDLFEYIVFFQKLLEKIIILKVNHLTYDLLNSRLFHLINH
jgi:hypothetical protein